MWFTQKDEVHRSTNLLHLEMSDSRISLTRFLDKSFYAKISSRLTFN